MTIQIVATRKFAITVGNRRIEFTPDTPITAKQRRVLRDRHYNDGWVKEIDFKVTPHILLRADGRLAHHNLAGTDANLDLEYLCLRAAADFLGADGARAKGQGQPSYLEAIFAKVRKEFAGQFDEILIDGADDPTKKYDAASLLMAHTPEVADAARKFISTVIK